MTAVIDPVIDPVTSMISRLWMVRCPVSDVGCLVFIRHGLVLMRTRRVNAARGGMVMVGCCHDRSLLTPYQIDGANDIA